MKKRFQKFNFNIDKVASLAEIVSAFALIISLLYVAHEVKQNTKATKATTFQAINDAEDQYWSSLSSNKELSIIWNQGLKNGMSSLNTDEQTQFTISIRRLIYMFQNVHYQRRKDVVDDEMWDAWVASLDEFLTEPGFQDVIQLTKPHLSSYFIELIDSRLEEKEIKFLLRDEQPLGKVNDSL